MFEAVLSYFGIIIYVMRKVWIGTIRGLSCANLGSGLRATINNPRIGCVIRGLHPTKCAKLGLAAYPWIDHDQLARDKRGYLVDIPGQSKIPANISRID